MMSAQQPTVGDAHIGEGDLRQETLRTAPADARFDEHDDWLEEPEELPRRPRRRLLGAGGNPIFLSLLGVLLVACGFIAGVLVEKGQGSSTSSAGASAGLASRIAGLRGAAGTGTGASADAGTGTGGANPSGAGRAGAGGFAGVFAGAGGGATAGQVAFIAGSTLYVTTAQGNTVKVRTSPASSVTKTVTASVKGIHPGETVLVTGTNSNGTISAESIRVGGGGGLGGIGALFGGSGSGGSSAGSGRSGGEPALFGEGK
jgi:hypothetical protein